jgi:O-antigen/teichoic acid export membrane protein
LPGVPDHPAAAGRADEARTRGGSEHRAADLSTLARGGLLNLVGAAIGGLCGFLLVVVLTRGLGPQRVGAFFVGVALFQIVANTAELGSDTGLVRMIARHRALERVDEPRRIIPLALIPVAVAGCVLGGLMIVFAPDLAEVFSRNAPASLVEPYVRWFGVFLPVAALLRVSLAGTRGFGTMLPTVTIDKIGKPAGQLVLATVAVALGGEAVGIALSYSVPIFVGTVVAIGWLGILVRRWEASRPGPREVRRRWRALAAEYWRFTAPRGFAGFFQVGVLWLDTLLVGALASTAAAGIYGAATRFIQVGTFANVAIIQAIGPRLSEVLAREEHDRAQHLWEGATAWLMLLVWPFYFTLIVFGSTVLGIFGPSFEQGAVALAIIASASLVANGVGPVDIVLLMGGRSGWQLANTIVALTLNVGLNLLLIPSLGIEGAAIAWGASLLANNLLPLAEVWAFQRLHPFGRAWLRVVVLSVGCVFLPSLVVRLVAGAGLVPFFAVSILGYGAYLVGVWRSREVLDLAAFRDVVRRRRGGGRPEPRPGER